MLGLSVLILGMTVPKPPVALLSPYRRPTLLQPRRLLAEFYAAYGEAVLASRGIRIGKLGEDFEIRDAGRRGRGLFALRDFEDDEVVTRYSGIVATVAEYREAFDAGLTTGTYIANGNSDGSLVLDSEKAETVLGEGPGRYVNHSKLWANCIISVFTLGPEGDQFSTGAAYIRTNRPIKAGDEFLTDYGSTYWDSEFSRFDVQRFMIDYWP